MKRLQTLQETFIGWLVVLLASLTITAIFSWPHTQYVAYTFFISWGLLFLFYIVRLRNYYSLLLIALAIGALGVYFTLVGAEATNTEAALLIGKIGLTIFTALLGYRLFKNKGKLENNNILYLGLLGLLVFQILIQDIKEVDALSVGGFVNYFTVGLIVNILLNGHTNKILNSGEKAILTIIAISSLYNISLMLIANFS